MIPVEEQSIISLLYRTSLIFDADYSLGSYVMIDANVTKDTLAKIQAYLVDDQKALGALTRL